MPNALCFSLLTRIVGILLLNASLIAAQNGGSNPAEVTRVAIVMGGGVSLGAFEAGAIAEIVRQFEQHNLGPQNHKYVIDILAGASAGSMTLALLGREMFQCPVTGVPPQEGTVDWGKYASGDNVFHEAWVKQIDISGLLPLSPKGEERRRLEHDGNLFSTAPIERTAGIYLADTLGGRLSIAGDSLYLAMTLANYDGRKRQIHYQNDQRTVTFYTDQRNFMWHLVPVKAGPLARTPETGAEKKGFKWYLQHFWGIRRLIPANRGQSPRILPRRAQPDSVVSMELENSRGELLPDTSVGWEAVRETAIASGAFPVAFPPKAVKRYLNEFDGNPQDTTGETKVRYIDGGFFNNSPLFVATDIAKRKDGGIAERVKQRYTAGVDRQFVFLKPIDPPATNSSGNNIGSGTKEPSPIDRWTSYLFQLVDMGLSTAQSIDDQLYIAFQDKTQGQVVSLADIVVKMSADSTAAYLGAVRSMRDEGIYTGDWNLLRVVTRAQQASDDRTIPQNLEKEFGKRVPAADSAKQATEPLSLKRLRAADALTKRLYVELFDFLGYDFPSRYILLSNEDQPLAGSQFSHFGGFFSEDFREYDYQMGRIAAQRCLKEQFGPDFAKIPFDTDTTRVRQLREDYKKRSHGVAIDSEKTLKEHVPEEAKRAELRRRVNQRLRLYGKQLKQGWGVSRFSLTPVGEIADDFLDKNLYRTPKLAYFLVQNGLGSKGRFHFGVATAPWQWGRWSTKCFQPGNRLCDIRNVGWVLASETRLVASVGINPGYRDLGVQASIFDPTRILDFMRNKVMLYVC